MATYRTMFPGNAALQTEVWILTLDEAKAAMAELNMCKGGYWDRNIGRPYRAASRRKSPTLTVYTAGFASGEFSNVLYATGSTVEQVA